MDEDGIVVEVGEGVAQVRVTRSDACSSCSQSSMCQPGEGSERTVSVRDPLGVLVGQQVSVRLPESGTRFAITLVYVWPVVAMFIGGFIGYKVGFSGGPERADLFSAAGATAGLAGAFWLLRVMRHRYEGSASLQPRITRIVR
ncbi:MAG: SoxR reducing system RseC family protein [Leptospirillia bacterium]